MANLDNQKFNQLLEAGQLEEAKKLLKEFIDSEWTKEDEGEYYVNLIEQYVKLGTAINTAYVAELTEIKEQLEALDDIENAVDKNAALGKIRDDITKL